jgi:hypothetical protein
MIRSVSALVALIVTWMLAAGSPPPARAAGSWAELTRRIAASQPNFPLNVVLGAEPPLFTFPLNARPPLPVLGSTYFLVVPGAPQGVRVYYAPTPKTTAAVDALVAKLRDAHYTEIAGSGFPNGFVGDDGPARIWCPADLRGPQITFSVENVDGVPALEMYFLSYAGNTSCSRGALDANSAGSQIPAFRGIPGLRIYASVRTTESAEASLGSVGIIRTSLPPADAVAKLAERFTAKGWTARAPVADGTAIVQHFTRTDALRRWNALLVFEPRGAGRTLYDAALDVTSELLGAAGR